MIKTHDKILDVLLLLAPTLNWLSEVEPISAGQIPPEHLAAVKQLENLGLVYRRNCRNCSLQRHRLIMMLKRESQQAAAPKREQCFSVFASILALELGFRPDGSPDRNADLSLN